MDQSFEPTAPVVIGGVGGSGTRVVAEIVSQLGFYLGEDLNSAKDNLWFLMLFKRPRWFQKTAQDSGKIYTGLSLFSKAMLHQNRPDWQEVKFLIQAVFEIAFFGHNHMGDGRGIWPFFRAWRMLLNKPRGLANKIGWGWKEPNSHIYLEYLAAYFTKLKYIHTIRHGLDMAFSKNQQQLYNWGPLFGVQPPPAKHNEPAVALKYWLRSNQRVLKIGRQLGKERFMMVRFDRLCLYPKSEVCRIASLLNIEAHSENLAAAVRIPRKPRTHGRYRRHDIRQFDPDDIEALRELGFSLDPWDD